MMQRGQSFSVVSSDRTRANRNKLQHRMLPLNMKHFFTVRVSEHQHRLPREIVESSTLDISKSSQGLVQVSWFNVLADNP